MAHKTKCSGCSKWIDWDKNDDAFQTGTDWRKRDGVAHWCSDRCQLAYKIRKYMLIKIPLKQWKEIREIITDAKTSELKPKFKRMTDEELEQWVTKRHLGKGKEAI